MCRSSLMRHGLIGPICSALGTWSSVFRADFGKSAPVLLIATSALTLYRLPDRALYSTTQISLQSLIAR